MKHINQLFYFWICHICASPGAMSTAPRAQKNRKIQEGRNEINISKYIICLEKDHAGDHLGLEGPKWVSPVRRQLAGERSE